jgi:hypothetical protein
MSKNDRYAHLGGDDHNDADTETASRTEQSENTVELTLRNSDGDERVVQVETDLPLDELADSMTGRTSLLARAQSLTTLQRASMGLGIAVIVGGGIVLTRRRRKTN